MGLRKKTRGVSLLEVVVASGLFAMIAATASHGIIFSQSRLRAMHQDHSAITQMDAQIEQFRTEAVLSGLGIYSGYYQATGNRWIGTPRAVSPFTFTMQQDASVPSGDVWTVTTTTTWSDNAPRSATVDSKIFVPPRPGMIGVKFVAPQGLSVSSVAPTGVFSQINWNNMTNVAAGNGAQLINADGQGTTVSIASSTSTIGTASSNVGVSEIGPIFSGGISVTGTTTLTISGIPYSKYSLIVYIMMTHSCAFQSGYVSLSSAASRTFVRASTSGHKGRNTYVPGQNYLLYSNLSGSSQTFTIEVSSGTMPVHAIQIIQEVQ